jgi:hypothetical protein
MRLLLAEQLVVEWIVSEATIEDEFPYTQGDAHLAIVTSDSKTNTKYYNKLAQQQCKMMEDAFIPRLRTLEDLAILVQHDDDDTDGAHHKSILKTGDTANCRLLLLAALPLELLDPNKP